MKCVQITGNLNEAGFVHSDKCSTLKKVDRGPSVSSLQSSKLATSASEVVIGAQISGSI